MSAAWLTVDIRMMQVRYTTDAVRDLTHIGDYTLGEYGVDAARNTALQIQKNVDLICGFPEIGRFGRKAGTREWVIPRLPFILIYRLRGEAVEVVRILHGAQRWP